MRFASYEHNGSVGIGFVNEDATLTPLSGRMGLPFCMTAFIGMGVAGTAAALQVASAADAGRLPLLDVKVLAPIPRPRNSVLCVGRNYMEHVKETDASNPVPTHPIIFSKPPFSVIASGETVALHADMTSCVDYEGELAVVIGKTARNVTEENAMDVVFGYTILNDVSARDLQKRHTQWVIGKGLDTFCPMGPFITHKSAMPDPTNISLCTKVNGEVRQIGNTRDLIFTIPHLIALLTRGMTLEPGDILATGTPKGVGAGFTPPLFLKKGDLVEIAIDGIGTLRNTFV